MLNLRLARLIFDKLKFARDAYTISRHPSIKDGLGFLKGNQELNKPKGSRSQQGEREGPYG